MKLSIVSIMAVLAVLCLGQANANDEQALRGAHDANLELSRDLLGDYMEDIEDEDYDEENRELGWKDSIDKAREAIKNRTKKSMCYKDEQCKGGLKCSHHKLRVLGKDITIGICTDGKNGSPCLKNESCQSNKCVLGFRNGKLGGKCMAGRTRGNRGGR